MKQNIFVLVGLIQVSVAFAYETTDGFRYYNESPSTQLSRADDALFRNSLHFVTSSIQQFPARLTASHFCTGAAKQVSSLSTAPLRDVITAAEANELFAKLKSLKGADIELRDSPALDFKFMNFEAPEDGLCSLRATIMSKYLEQQGIYSRKLSIYGNFAVDNPWVFRNQMPWKFHVAPLVKTMQPDGTIQEMVLDPSMASKPQPKDLWMSKISRGANCTLLAPEADDIQGDTSCRYRINERFTNLAARREQRFRTDWDTTDFSTANGEFTDETLEKRVRERQGIAGKIDESGWIIPTRRCINYSRDIQQATNVLCK